MRQTTKYENLGKGDKVSVFFYLEKENKPGKAKGRKNHLKIQTDENGTTEKTHKGLEQKLQHGGKREL